MKNTNEQALEIGKKIQEKIEQKNWNQSDLARAASMGRDSISTYIRGLVMPEPKNLKRLADALECGVSELSPYKTIKIDNGQIFEIKEADNGNFLIKINRRVTANQAAAIFDALRQ
jgi:transcriptional regulator with XRE-family HTH domain